MKLNKIKKALENMLISMDFGQVGTDKGIIQWDGDEDLKAGDYVKGMDEDGETHDLADGDYKTEDGKTIVVKDGKVEEIKDKEAEVADEEPTAEEKFKTMKQNFSMSYSDRERAIMEAYGSVYGYLYEAGDDYAIFCYYGENYDEYKYFKYSVSWEGETAAITLVGEVKQAFIPVDVKVEDIVAKSAEIPVVGAPEGIEGYEKVEDELEPKASEDTTEDKKDEKVAELENKVSELEDKIKALEDVVKELEPKSVEEQFNAMKSKENATGRQGRLMDFANA